jgi:nucleotide-binding universal stress UspA family protein
MPKILVPLDGSAFAERAVETARAIAARQGAAIEFVSVHEPELPPSRIGGAPVRDPRLNADIRASLLGYITRIEAAERARSALAITAAFREGPVAEEIVAQITEGEASLVVMTTHGRGGVERLWLGSVADRVIRSATVPVLLVRPTETAAASLDPVVVAVEGSDQDDRIVASLIETVDIARARITLAHVVLPTPVAEVMEPAVLPPPDELAGVPAPELSDRVHAAGRYLEWMAGPLRAGGAVVDTRVQRVGSAPRAILDIAREVGANLVVVGTAARTPLRRLFMGSVADKVVRSAHCNVLVCPAKPAEQ